MAGYIKRQFRRAKKAVIQRYKKGGMAKVISDVKYLKGLVNSELKYADFSQSGNMAVGSAAGWSSVHSLNSITQGDGPSNRDGASIRIKSLQIRGSLERVAGTHKVRVLVLLDRNPLSSGALGAVAQPQEVFKDPTDLMSLRAWDGVQQRRFKILYSTIWDVDADELQQNFKLYRKLDLPVNWSTTTGSGTDFVRNRLLLCFMSDNVTATDVTYSFEARVTYRDN